MNQQAVYRRRPRTGREIVQTLLVALGIYLAVQMLIPPYAVDGASMSPNLRDGERLFVNRSLYARFDVNRFLNLLPGEDDPGERIVYPFHDPERGEIVVFYPPGTTGKPYIKRIIGLPGDQIAFEDGFVTLNGERLDETYIAGGITYCEDSPHCRLTVPEGMVYVLGDNRDNSSDSRLFGPVSIDSIIGKAWIANWPLDAIGVIPGVDYDR
jgi:signal peptidase I